MMGLVHADIAMKNPRTPEVPAMTVNMLVDSGSVHLCIPEKLCAQLGLEVIENKTVILADGKRRKVPYAGPVQLQFKNRTGFTGALVMGDEPLFGVIPMEDMDLVVLPKEQRLDVNPKNPRRGGSVAKGGGGM